MAGRRGEGQDPYESPSRPATTPEGREHQLVRLAVDLAEKQIREGTVSAAVLTHYVKLGSSREFLEQQRIAMEIELLKEKQKQIERGDRIEALYSEALSAMRTYSGQEPLQMGDDDENL